MDVNSSQLESTRVVEVSEIARKKSQPTATERPVLPSNGESNMEKLDVLAPPRLTRVRSTQSPTASPSSRHVRKRPAFPPAPAPSSSFHAASPTDKVRAHSFSWEGDDSLAPAAESAAAAGEIVLDGSVDNLSLGYNLVVATSPQCNEAELENIPVVAEDLFEDDGEASSPSSPAAAPSGAARVRADSIECSGLSEAFKSTLAVSVAPQSAESALDAAPLGGSGEAAAVAAAEAEAGDGDAAGAAAWLERCLP